MADPIIDLLIEHYTEAISMYKRTKNFQTLLDNNVQYGICNCAHNEWDELVFHKSWLIENKAPGSAYWYPTPFKHFSFEDNLHLLELRLNKLKEINSVLG